VFEEAKKVIAEKVEEGVKLYDPKLHTGLLTDWWSHPMPEAL
jgi:hypothetical protein